MEKAKFLTVLSIGLLILLAGTNGYWIWTTNQPMQSPEKIKVRFAYQFGFHYGQQIIMDYFDLVEKYTNGTVIAEYSKISGGAQMNEAFIAGSLEFGSMGITPAIKGIDQGVGIKILLSMGSKEHELWTWRDDIRTIADIKFGDKVAVVAIGSIEHVSLIKAFIDLGRTKEDADAVACFFKHPDAYTLMEERKIDVDFTGVPYTLKYASNPERYHKIGCDSEIWGTPLPGSVLVGRVDFCEEHPDVVAAVIAAWFEATNWIINNPEEASRIIGAVYEYEPEEAWELWQDSQLVWNPTFGLTAVEDVANIMYDLGLLENQLTFEDLLFEETRGMVGL